MGEVRLLTCIGPTFAKPQTDNVTTPPPPSSSPGPLYESMDISPLPHKTPFVVETQVEPTPMETFTEEFSSSVDFDNMEDYPMEPSRPIGLTE